MHLPYRTSLAVVTFFLSVILGSAFPNGHPRSPHFDVGELGEGLASLSSNIACRRFRYFLVRGLYNDFSSSL